MPVAFEDPESGKPYYFDAKTGESTWEFPGAWKEVASDEHGQPYYHNAEERARARWERGGARVETDESGRERTVMRRAGRGAREAVRVARASEARALLSRGRRRET